MVRGGLNVLDEFLSRAPQAERHLSPVRRFQLVLNDLPSIGGSPVPFLPRQFVSRTVGTNTSFDAGRGCPFQCSFGTIINVQGRKSRYRSADDIEVIVRQNWAQGIARFLITDDNFARNKNWEEIFDRLAKPREVDKIPLGLLIQVDTRRLSMTSMRRRSTFSQKPTGRRPRSATKRR